MQSVRRLASGWGDSAAGGFRHPLAKPDWVKSVVLQLAIDVPQAGCRTFANSFNVAHSASNQTVSKTWVAKLLKARGLHLPWRGSNRGVLAVLAALASRFNVFGASI